MNFTYLGNRKALVISALAGILNLSLLANIAQAKPVNKALKNTPKFSSLESIKSQSLDLRLKLSSNIANTTNTEKFEQEKFLELSKNNQTIPLNNQPLIARTFGGQASWYGPGFHGRLTANGERYNQNAMTAAHPTLRFGTRVKVTNLRNRRSVVVRINDRGPYAKGRVIDVSAAAARSLGMIKSGVAPVKVTILGR